MRNMNCHQGVCILVALFAIVSCQDAKKLTDSERENAKREVKAVLDSVSQSVQAHGLVGFIPFLDQSPESRWTYRNHTVNYDTLVTGTRAESGRYRSVTIQWDSVATEPWTSDRATVTANYVETLIDTAGKESSLFGTIKGEMTRTAQGWKFHIIHTDSAHGAYPAFHL